MPKSWLHMCGPPVHFSVSQELQRSISPTRATVVGESARGGRHPEQLRWSKTAWSHGPRTVMSCRHFDDGGGIRHNVTMVIVPSGDMPQAVSQLLSRSPEGRAQHREKAGLCASGKLIDVVSPIPTTPMNAIMR